MIKRRLPIVMFLGLLLIAALLPICVASGQPLSDARSNSCDWRGDYYLAGSSRPAEVTLNGRSIRTDYYQCQNGTWVYRYSEDDVK